MIVVEATLRPGGVGSPCRLCRLEIANDVSKTLSTKGARGDYTVKLFSRGDNPRLIREARIEDWPRNAVPAWRLVQKAFEVIA